MANTKRNMLAELEKRLDIIVFGLVTDGHPCDETIDIRKAQRIVAELAKVRMTSPMLLFNRPAADESVKAVDRCLEIAEKGEKDEGK